MMDIEFLKINCGLAGYQKEKAKINLWLKEIAPSDVPPERFSHDPSRWENFKERYRKELEPKKGYF